MIKLQNSLHYYHYLRDTPPTRVERLERAQALWKRTTPRGVMVVSDLSRWSRMVVVCVIKHMRMGAELDSGCEER